MSTLILENSRASAQATGWIISKRDDLTWFVGSSLIGLMFLSVVLALGWAPTPVVILWLVFINTPHVFSTTTRILFDAAERKRIGAVWLMLVPLILIGPALTYAFGEWAIYLLIVVWGHYHISKQHMGFVMLYRAKNGEREAMKSDKNHAVYALMLPLAYYLSARFISDSPVVLLTFLLAAVTLTGVYVTKQFRKTNQNWPKLILLLSCVPLTWAAFIYAASDLGSINRLGIAVIATNIPHSLQYLRLVWFHNDNRYRNASGTLGLISRSAFYFFLFSLTLSLPTHFIGPLGKWGAGIVSGFLFFHYVVDGMIWRVRGDKELASALRL